MNEVVITTAGGGKTTRIVREILANPGKKSLVVTYTQNNYEEIKHKFYAENGAIPEHVTIKTWFGFLLTDVIRPYQNFVHEKRIENIIFVQGKSVPYVPKSSFEKYFLKDGSKVYTDKISELGLICNEKSKGKVLARLTRLYDSIYFDEIQDLAGYDLDILELLLQSTLKIVLVGDHRQATYQTNYSQRNKQFAGMKIINKFSEWEKAELCTLKYALESFRSNQDICDFSDTILGSGEKTVSKNGVITGHDGVFYIEQKEVEEYIEKHSPKILRYDKRTNCFGYDNEALNWGDSKGLTFDRVLIIPHGPFIKAIATGDMKHIKGSLAKVYVALTRARYSVAIVFNGSAKLTIKK